ncbi:hypothetical protein SUDANB15_02532 [Streptomyces sp. enrichment culture]|uniref:hypothetical protein n=1 Tax=Streptomyces sp. enrichment culture TaxID=1795815 RepID=UPI003F5449D0
MRTRTTVGILAALALTACSSEDNNTAATKPTPATSAASTSPASPSPTPNTDTPLAVGDTYTSTVEDQGLTYKATITVLDYEHDFDAQASAAEEVNADGYVWSSLEIKVCAKSDGISVSQFPWVLAYADGSRFEPSDVSYGDFPKPEYPLEAQVKNGDCVRGKIPYAVPGDQKPIKVIYAPDGMREPVEWTLPRT